MPLVANEHAAPADLPYRRDHKVLYPFQELAVSRLARQQSAAFVYRPWNGALTMALAASRSHVETAPQVQRVVVLTEPTLGEDCRTQIEAFTAPENIMSRVGSVGQRWRTYATTPAQWLIVSLGVLSSDVDALLPLMPTSLLVIAPSVGLIERNLKRSQAATLLSRAAAQRLVALSPAFNYGADDWEHLMSLAFGPDTAAYRRVTRDTLARIRHCGNNYLLTITQQD